MNKLPACFTILLLFAGAFLVAQRPVLAVTIAEQTQNFGNSLNVWQAIQELGTNLSGTAQSFTFRVSTSAINTDQFDFTAQNSKIYDKSTNTSISGCIPAGTNPSDRLRGLTFTTSSVPSGYQDVTIDFSCRDYTFDPTHNYLIHITNANLPNLVAGLIQFAAAAYGAGGEQTTDRFTQGGLRYGNGNKFDSSHNSGSCDPVAYKWNDPNTTPQSGCFVWTTTKDDLYFVLTNTSPPPPPPKTPVIFIPGIGGSELKASQDIIWSSGDGHGGTFSHGYTTNEKIWVNQDEAAKLGDDDYFDVLRLKTDGITSEASLSLTGSLTPFGYGDIDSFFTGLGYEKGKNFFVFPYDWRKDVRETRDSLDVLVEEAKTKSGQTKVNIVVHSMGGLVARYYISDSGKASKVNKLISMGVPHLGAVDGLKTLRYGSWLGYDFRLFTLGIPPSQTKDGAQNMPSIYELIPSLKYYDFYNNSTADLLFPIKDDRDVDNNKEVGPLNFSQTKTHLSNLGHNMTVFGIGDEFHTIMDPLLNTTNGVKIYLIVGTSQPTLGQLHETWWVTWPINLIPKTEEVFINGDDTVPLYSASLKNNISDLSGGATIHYVEQTHGDLVKSTGIAMQTVKAILNEDSLPVEVKSEKIDLEGQQISLDDGELELYDETGNHTGIKDDGEVETNIPETFYSTSGKTKHAFVKKKAKKVKVRTTRKKKTSSDPKTTNVKIRTYKQDKVSKTTTYRDILITETAKVEFDLDPAVDTSPSFAFFPDSTKSESTSVSPTSEVSGSPALDQTSPTTKIEKSGTNPVTITLTGSDSDSGILKIEYSLDNGKTVQTYTNPFTISNSGKTTLQVKSIDKLGNEEIPQEVVIEIASSSSNSSSSSSSSSGSSLSENTSEVKSSNTSNVGIPNEVAKPEVDKSPDILGISTQDPVSSAQYNQPLTNNQPNLLTSSMLIFTMIMTQSGIILLSALRSVISFLKPPPK